MADRPKPPRPERRAEQENLRLSQLSPEERGALDELAQVEAAMASLEGRSTEAAHDLIMSRRDAEKRKADISKILGAAEARIAKKRRALIIRYGAGAGVVVLGLVFAGVLIKELVHESSLSDASRAALDSASAPYNALGFREVKTYFGKKPIDLTAARDDCFIAIGSTESGPARVRVDRERGVTEGASVAWCSCASETPHVQAVGSGEEPGVRVLMASATAIGGSDLLGELRPKPAEVIAEPHDRACAEGALDAYLRARKQSDATPTPDDADKAFIALGFELVAREEASAPFLLIPDRKETCFVAHGHDAKDLLSLRVPGGARPLEKSRAVALCRSSGEPISIWREGSGAITALAVPASRAGGRMGMREAFARAGLDSVPVYIPDADLALDAKSLLEGSGVHSADLLAPEKPGPRQMFAISTNDKTGLILDPKAVEITCKPDLRWNPFEVLCLASSPIAWIGDALPPGTSTAEKPRWLAPLSSDPHGVDAAIHVLELVRRLTLEGYELTTLVAAKETPAGATILGQAGQKQIIALALSSAPPFVHILTNGPAWALDGDPIPIPLAPGAEVDLTATPKYVHSAKPAHELVVFRR